MSIQHAYIYTSVKYFHLMKVALMKFIFAVHNHINFLHCVIHIYFRLTLTSPYISHSIFIVHFLNILLYDVGLNHEKEEKKNIDLDNVLHMCYTCK